MADDRLQLSESLEKAKMCPNSCCVCGVVENNEATTKGIYFFR